MVRQVDGFSFHSVGECGMRLKWIVVSHPDCLGKVAERVLDSKWAATLRLHGGLDVSKDLLPMLVEGITADEEAWATVAEKPVSDTLEGGER